VAPDPELVQQLDRARALGFLGPGPVAAHIDHAAVFVSALVGVDGVVVDLGSGGGVPGLVVALARPDLEVVLVDAMAKRCRFLRSAVAALGLEDRVRIVEARAEEVGRGALRSTASAVTARSFGPPAATAECAAPLLQLGGRLIVSEPPDGPARWPAASVAELGLRIAARPEAGGPRVQVLEQVAPCPDRFPRRVGVPSKRPLF
jgi:16S rRNA (guanine527-N7)-methyltransferase